MGYLFKLTKEQLLAAMENGTFSETFPQLIGVESDFDPYETTDSSRVTFFKVGKDVLLENGGDVEAMYMDECDSGSNRLLSRGWRLIRELDCRRKVGR